MRIVIFDSVQTGSTLVSSLLLCLSSFASSPAHADTHEELPAIGITELVAAARKDPPAVLQALSTLRRVHAEQHLAEGAYLPKLTAQGTLGALYENRRVLPGEAAGGRIDSTSWAATAEVAVDWAALDLERKYNVRAAEAASTSQQSGVQASVRVAVIAAVELYVRALSAADLERDALLTLERRAQQQTTIEELSVAGVRPAVDGVRARVELVAARWMHELRITEQKAAHAALAAAIGRAPEEGLRPLPIRDDVFAGPDDVRQASTLARANRPELAELRKTILSYDELARAASMNRLPKAGVFANGQSTYYDVRRGDGIQGDQYSANGGAYLRWQGGDATLVRQANVARARVDEARRALQTLEMTVRVEAVDALYGVQRSHAQLQQATQVLEAAQATRAVQHERYGVGVASLLELMDAESIEQNARRARIEAVRDYQLARARLLAVCGALESRLD